MDDDVRNLFQKFGQSTDGYQEINRESGSEQARQRWPLLRDVRIHASPEPVQHTQAPAPQVFSQFQQQQAVIPVSPAHPLAPAPAPANAATSTFFAAQAAAPSVAASAPPAFQPAFQFAHQAPAPLPAQAPAAPAGGRFPFSSGGEQPVSAVFGRLAGKPPEPAKTAEPVVHSFFKKIFKP